MKRCPICLSKEYDSRAELERTVLGSSQINCGTCGRFVMSSEDQDDLDTTVPLTDRQRAALSHAIRRRHGFPSALDSGNPVVSVEGIEKAIADGLELPSPLYVADAILRKLGELQKLRGVPIGRLPVGFHAMVGASDRGEAHRIVQELRLDGLVEAPDPGGLIATLEGQGRVTLFNIDPQRLTLAGWRRWESLDKGEYGGGGGFIAMQFGDERLDELVREVISPALKGAGFQLNRVDDNMRSGIIDNIIREDIKSADFVLAELTHSNLGAYWEAGYAEGLGKPVIYLCEKRVFENEEIRPHFDVNHRTTVIWSYEEPEEMLSVLIATIKNSL